MDRDGALAYLRSYTRPLTIMEVCGTHTAAIAASGLRSLLPPAIRLVSGPGCPVCVASPAYIDGLVALARRPGHTVLAFGDLFRVAGNGESLAMAKAAGASVRLIYSPLEALSLAREFPDATFVVAAVGFETTAPVFAVLLEKAAQSGLENIGLVTALKTMPPALDFICRQAPPDAFLCPGHVSTIIGLEPYRALCQRYRRSFVVAGFEPEHLVAAICAIAVAHEQGRPRVANLYPSAVTGGRQAKAWERIERFFTPGPAAWRGIGVIPDSGLYLRGEYSRFGYDAGDGGDEALPAGCGCGEVLLGRMTPADCPLFGGECTPERAVGPCMVSSEGACAVWYAAGGGMP